MKEFKTTRLAVTSAGCFLGAGYVSGQELWKFFGAFGVAGLPGRVMALAIQLVFVILILQLGRKTGLSSLDRVLIPEEKPVLHSVVGIFQLIFLFGVTVVMAAGAGALVQQMFHFPAALGGAVFCFLAMLVTFRGMEGLSKICGVLVPAMIVTAMVISVITVAKTGLHAVWVMPDVHDSPLIPNWWIAALTYVSYNIFGAIGVLTPVGPHVADEKTLRKGSTLGVVMLLAISLGILPAVGVRPDAALQELPMLALAEEIHPLLGYLYSVLLLTGMMGTTVSFWVAASIYVVQRKPDWEPVRKRVILVQAVLAFGGSLLGFGDLIGTFYPIFGYLGFAAMFLLLRHYLIVKKREKTV